MQKDLLTMLGFKRNTAPASPEASKEIRQTARRIASGNLNDNDRRAINRQKMISSLYKAEWK